MTRHGVATFSIVLLAAVLATAGGLIVFRLPLAEALLRRGLAAEGIAPATFAVAELGLHNARLTGIALGRAQEAEIAELRLSYTPRALLSRQIDGIDIAGLRLRLDLTGSAPPLGSLQQLLARPDTAAEGTFPLPLARIMDARIEAATPAGPVTAAVSGEVTPQADGRLRATVDLSLVAALGARVTGTLTAAGDPAADLDGTLTVSDGTLQIGATEVAGAEGEFRFRLHAFQPESIIGGVALGHLALEGSQVPGAALEIAATPKDARLVARASSGDGTFDAELQAEIADLTGAPRLRATGRAGLDLAAPVAADLWPRIGAPQPDGGRAELRLSARADAPDDRPWQLSAGELDLDLELADLITAAASLASAQLHLPLGLAAQDAALSVFARGNGSFNIADVDLRLGDSRLRALKPLAGDITALEAVQPLGPAAAPPKLAVAMRPGPAILEVAGADATSWRLEIGSQRLEAAYQADATGAPALHVSLVAGRIAAPDFAIAGEAVSMAADLTPAWALRRADFAVGALRHLADSPAFAPWSLSGALQGREETIHLDATAKGPQNHGTVTASGDLRPAEGSGLLVLRFAPLTFAEEGPAPATFLPALSAIRAARGNVSATAELEWGAARPIGRARLMLEDLAFAAPGARVSDLDLDLTFDRLYPPQTPPDQRLTISRIDSGVPLRDLDLRFRILPHTPPKLAIRNAQVTVLDGELSLSEVTIDPAKEQVAVPLTAQRLGLAAFFKLIDVEGLAGEGRLSGRIPLVFSHGAVAVEGGHLAAEGPGSLRIRSEAARRLLASGGESTELVLDALEDFRYSELTLDLTKELAADPRLTLSMLGYNPAVLEGHPIRFNVNLEGRTGRLLDSLSEAYSLSNRLLLKLWQPR